MKEIELANSGCRYNTLYIEAEKITVHNRGIYVDINISKDLKTVDTIVINGVEFVRKDLKNDN